MTATPVVSVVIPCYNVERYGGRAVKSVLDQTFSNLECILVEDGSSDRTPALLKAIAQRDSRVRVIFTNRAGPGGARNAGIRVARGRWIQLLDADDWLNKDKLRFQLAQVDGAAHTRPIVLYADYEVVEQRPESTRASDFRLLHRIEIGRLTKRELLIRLLSWNFKADGPLHPNSVLFSRVTFDEQLFDEELRSCADLELFANLLLRDVDFVYTPIVGMWFRQHASSLTKDAGRFYHYYVRYLERLCEKDPKLIGYCPSMLWLLRWAARRNDQVLLDRLGRLVSSSSAPVNVSVGGMQLNVSAVVGLVHRFGLLPLFVRAHRVCNRQWRRCRRACRSLIGGAPLRQRRRR